MGIPEESQGGKIPNNFGFQRYEQLTIYIGRFKHFKLPISSLLNEIIHFITYFHFIIHT